MASAAEDSIARDPYADLPKVTDEVKEVRVEGLVVLEIIQHCTTSLPTLASGCLLGLGKGSVLEVTHSFGTPNILPQERAQADAEGQLHGEAYQYEMMRLLTKVNVDNNCVGWYRASHMGSFIDENLVKEMINYQNNLPMSVLFVYDPFRTVGGHLALKAYRLRNEFVQDYKSKSFRQNTTSDLGESEVFVEIPIVVTNDSMIQSFLWDLKSDMPDDLDTDFDRFDLSTNPFLEKNLEFLSQNIDALGAEQVYIDGQQKKVTSAKERYQKIVNKKKMENIAREAEGKPPVPEHDPDYTFPKPPNRLKALLVASQINEYCDQVNKFNGQGFSKLFLAGSLRKGD